MTGHGAESVSLAEAAATLGLGSHAAAYMALRRLGIGPIGRDQYLAADVARAEEIRAERANRRRQAAVRKQTKATAPRDRRRPRTAEEKAAAAQRRLAEILANPDDPGHRTSTGYRLGCRCPTCQETHRRWAAPRKLDRPDEVAAATLIRDRAIELVQSGARVIRPMDFAEALAEAGRTKGWLSRTLAALSATGPEQVLVRLPMKGRLGRYAPAEAPRQSRACRTTGCNRSAIADGLCRRCYGHRRRNGALPDLTGPQVGDPADHGRYGIMERQQDTALCHICGLWTASVGKHSQAVHQMGAAEYRRRYGLARGTPLVSLALSEAASRRSISRIGTAAWARLEAARDPVAASHARGPDAYRPAPEVAPSRVARAAALAAAMAQPHCCSVCGRSIPDWRGADDNRALCGRRACQRRMLAARSARSTATKAAGYRPLTAAERQAVIDATDTTLSALTLRLRADGVRQLDVAAARGISQSMLSRIVRRHGMTTGNP